jgi:hypothetical protein
MGGKDALVVCGDNDLNLLMPAVLLLLPPLLPWLLPPLLLRLLPAAAVAAATSHYAGCAHCHQGCLP